MRHYLEDGSRSDIFYIVPYHSYPVVVRMVSLTCVCMMLVCRVQQELEDNVRYRHQGGGGQEHTDHPCSRYKITDKPINQSINQSKNSTKQYSTPSSS